MKQLISILFLLIFVRFAYAQGVTDYLITNDIGSYKQITKGGPSGNILAGTDHFGINHKDATYGISYVNDTSEIWIDVQVTHQTGGDSNQWLLHEVEDGYRDSEHLDNQIAEASRLRKINDNIIFFYGGGEVGYSWLSNNIVVNIEYNNFGPAKPEPIEIVKAYLEKSPSTIPASFVLNRAHDEKWIKDEIERRLWLCDKWFALQTTKNTDIEEKLREINHNLTIFLDYREKYFGINPASDKQTLYQYLSTENVQGMKDKVSEYKSWWKKNKSNKIL